MGRDKALLELSGEPLVGHAVRKLSRLTPEVHILGNRPELAEFAPLVADLHPGCGPVAGMEAALLHTPCDWVLVLPVDMPFLPTVLLESWMSDIVKHPKARVALFSVQGVPHSVLCLLHRETASFMSSAAEMGKFKLYPVFEEAATELAQRQHVSMTDVLLNREWDDRASFALLQRGGGQSSRALTEAQLDARHLWFANLNTPEEFAEAKLHMDALDT